jgi:hypothetical protein
VAHIFKPLRAVHAISSPRLCRGYLTYKRDITPWKHAKCNLFLVGIVFIMFFIGSVYDIIEDNKDFLKLLYVFLIIIGTYFMAFKFMLMKNEHRWIPDIYVVKPTVFEALGFCAVCCGTIFGAILS